MKKKPNILFLLPDQHRGDWMPYDLKTLTDLSLEKLPIRMPNLEKLMERGMTFTKAITPSPLCAPARACLAAGKRYVNCRVSSNHDDYPLDQKTFYSVLKENGYRVAGVGKFDLHKNTRWWGLTGWLDDLETLGFTEGIDNAGKIDAVVSGKSEPKDPYMKYLYDRGLAQLHQEDMNKRGIKEIFPSPLPSDAYCDNWLTRNGLQLLEQFPPQQPWFLVVNFTGPHQPWDITEEMKEEWENINFPYPLHSSQDRLESIAIRQNYAAMLENIDRNIGLLIDEVERRGELENTIIIYSSDHGEMLGDFNRYGKCRPERASVHIPLIISGPGVQQGVVSDALIELQDLAATIVDMAGSTMQEADESISLLPLLEGHTTIHRNYAISQLGQNHHNPVAWEMITDGNYKLIIESPLKYRLYDLRNDPSETMNIAEGSPDIVRQLRDCLNSDRR